jgi:uncharacterized 2Fe-2S/4Fe-4S cluster protein (DUF4445 family)
MGKKEKFGTAVDVGVSSEIDSEVDLDSDEFRISSCDDEEDLEIPPW